MADYLDKQVMASGGGVEVGQAIMSSRPANKFTNDAGHIFLKDGVLETDLTGLPQESIREGIYSEPAGTSPDIQQSGISTYRLCISETGVSFQAWDKQAYAYYKPDFDTAPTIRNPLHPSGYSIHDFATNHNGLWYAVGESNHYAIRSEDDGATWETDTSFRATYESRIYYDKASDVFLAFKSASSTTAGDAKIWRNVGGAKGNWTEVGTFNTYSITTCKVFPPTEEDPNWYIATRAAGSQIYHVYRSSDQGASWQMVLSDTNGGVIDKQVNNIWSINGKVFYYHLDSVTSKIIEADIGHAPYDVNGVIEYVGDPDSQVDDIGLKIKEFGGLEHATKDGAVYFANGLMTTDGKTFVETVRLGSTSPFMRRIGNDLYFNFLDGTTTKTIRKGVPVAGTLTPHQQGSAFQFTRIK